ncbi:MAG: hypothetical protein K0S03_715 [Burkholderiales bacterium]|jgi:ElaB/YqjD/DUF883 family membrane-anchored ribosome-binding protein|nr:hypothetical protein [Burkholderiales bacterium]
MAIEYTSTASGMPGETREQREMERRAVIRRLDEARQAVAERTREAARYANEQVYGHPWTSVGVSLATGVVLGLLIGLSIRR